MLLSFVHNISEMFLVCIYATMIFTVVYQSNTSDVQDGRMINLPYKLPFVFLPLPF